MTSRFPTPSIDASHRRLARIPVRRFAALPHLRFRTQLAGLAFLGTVGTTSAQQAWTPLLDFGATGQFVQGAPFEPRVLQTGGREWSYADGAFEYRGQALPQQATVEQATYDPTGRRAVALLNSATAIGVFDGAHWSVRATPGVPARSAMAIVGDPIGGGVLMFGGLSPDGHPPTTELDDTWRLVGTRWTRLAPAHAPSARESSAMAIDSSSGRVVLFGGRSAPDLWNDTWQWSGSDWSQLVTAHAPSARSNHLLATDPIGGGLILYGGSDSAFYPPWLGDAWRFDGTDWSPLPAPLGGTPLTSPQFANVNGDLVLFGRTGYYSGVVHGLRWNGADWDEVYTSASVEQVSFPAYALDTVRNQVVRFGGKDWSGPNYRNETWVFDTRWRKLTPVTSPPPRNFARSVFDPAHGNIVLFGGFNGTSSLSDTWTWEGTNWRQHFPTNTPPVMRQPALAYDPTRGGVVLHGGDGPVMSTWLWDGSDWTQIPTTSQTPPATGSLAFHATNGELYFYAISFLPSSLWQLQGTAWVQVDHAPNYGQLTYDPLTGTLALFAFDGRHDYVDGAWVATGQVWAGTEYAYDPARGGLLGLGDQISLSTPKPAQLEHYGTGCGTDVTATLSFDRQPKLGSDMDAVVRAGTPGSRVLLSFGLRPAARPFGHCTTWISCEFLERTGSADAHGFASIDSRVPAQPTLAGLNVYAQAFVAPPPPVRKVPPVRPVERRAPAVRILIAVR